MYTNLKARKSGPFFKLFVMPDFSFHDFVHSGKTTHRECFADDRKNILIERINPDISSSIMVESIHSCTGY